jgi:hypothetical protein
LAGGAIFSVLEESSGTQKEIAMNAEKHFIAFAIAASLGVLGPASTAWAQSGGYATTNTKADM